MFYSSIEQFLGLINSSTKGRGKKSSYPGLLFIISSLAVLYAPAPEAAATAEFNYTHNWQYLGPAIVQAGEVPDNHSHQRHIEYLETLKQTLVQYNNGEHFELQEFLNQAEARLLVTTIESIQSFHADIANRWQNSIRPLASEKHWLFERQIKMRADVINSFNQHFASEQSTSRFLSFVLNRIPGALITAPRIDLSAEDAKKMEVGLKDWLQLLTHLSVVAQQSAGSEILQKRLYDTLVNLLQSNHDHYLFRGQIFSWIAEHYPNWFDRIGLSSLALGDLRHNPALFESEEEIIKINNLIPNQLKEQMSQMNGFTAPPHSEEFQMTREITNLRELVEWVLKLTEKRSDTQLDRAESIFKKIESPEKWKVYSDWLPNTGSYSKSYDQLLLVLLNTLNLLKEANTDDELYIIIPRGSEFDEIVGDATDLPQGSFEPATSPMTPDSIESDTGSKTLGSGEPATGPKAPDSIESDIGSKTPGLVEPAAGSNTPGPFNPSSVQFSDVMNPRTIFSHLSYWITKKSTQPMVRKNFKKLFSLLILTFDAHQAISEEVKREITGQYWSFSLHVPGDTDLSAAAHYIFNNDTWPTATRLEAYSYWQKSLPEEERHQRPQSEQTLVQLLSKKAQEALAKWHIRPLKYSSAPGYEVDYEGRPANTFAGTDWHHLLRHAKSECGDLL